MINEALLNQQSGTYSLQGEGLDFMYYDSVLLDNAILQHRLFTLPRGQAGKTLARTNMKTAAQVPQGNKMEVFSLGFYYTGITKYDAPGFIDYREMLKDTTIDFIIDGKATVFQAPLQVALGVSQSIEVTDTTQFSSVTSQKGVIPLNVPIVLAALTTFEIEFVHHVAPAEALNGDQLTITLNGLLKRSS